MSDRSIKARQSRKTGRVAISIEIDRQTWRSMSRSAREGGFADTLEYVAEVINTAFIKHGALAAKGAVCAEVKARAAPDTPQPEAEFDDIDDGIPF
jgi:hypothetical protein